MMKKAEEYRKMTDEVVNARMAEKDHDAQNYIDVVLVQLVEEAVKKGIDAIDADIPKVIDKMIVASKLMALGFTVEHGDKKNNLFIMW
jgi:hypothetical protein